MRYFHNDEKQFHGFGLKKLVKSVFVIRPLSQPTTTGDYALLSSHKDMWRDTVFFKFRHQLHLRIRWTDWLTKWVRLGLTVTARRATIHVHERKLNAFGAVCYINIEVINTASFWYMETRYDKVRSSFETHFRRWKEEDKQTLLEEDRPTPT